MTESSATREGHNQRPSYWDVKVKQTDLRLLKWTEGSSTEFERFHLMEKIANEWQKLGDILEIEPAQLEAISSQHQKRSDECCRAVLIKWRDNPPNNYPATWGGLINLLDDCNLSKVVDELKYALIKAKVK